MLYVVETDAGHVVAMYPCDDGIDQAIDIIAERLMHSEEDWCAACDVVKAYWGDAVRTAEDYGGSPYRWFMVKRTGVPHRFGLTSIE